jgi:hypothetical protein
MFHPSRWSEASTNHKSAVAKENLCPLWISDSEIALIERAVLIKKPMICRDQDVRKVGRRQLTDELCQIRDSILGRLGSPIASMRLW